MRSLTLLSREVDLKAPQNRHLEYVLNHLHNLKRLPQPRRTSAYLSVERNILRETEQRHNELIITAGLGRDHASPDELRQARNWSDTLGTQSSRLFRIRLTS